MNAVPQRFLLVGMEDGQEEGTTLVHLNLVAPLPSDADQRTPSDLSHAIGLQVLSLQVIVGSRMLLGTALK